MTDINEELRRAAGRKVVTLPFEAAPQPEAPTPAQLRAAKDVAAVLGLTLTEALERVGYEPTGAAPGHPAPVDMDTRIRKAAGR